MPVGVIVDALAVVIGGIVGAVAGKKLKKDFIDNMNLILGCCSMCMGVSTCLLYTSSWKWKHHSKIPGCSPGR